MKPTQFKDWRTETLIKRRNLLVRERCGIVTTAEDIATAVKNTFLFSSKFNYKLTFSAENGRSVNLLGEPRNKKRKLSQFKADNPDE